MTAAAIATTPAAVLPLEGELTIYRVAELKPLLLEALEGAAAPALEIDLAAVTEIDSAGIQLLLAAQHTARAAGRHLVLTRPVPPVREALDLLGAAACFGTPSAAA